MDPAVRDGLEKEERERERKGGRGGAGQGVVGRDCRGEGEGGGGGRGVFFWRGGALRVRACVSESFSLVPLTMTTALSSLCLLLSVWPARARAPSAATKKRKIRTTKPYPSLRSLSALHFSPPPLLSSVVVVERAPPPLDGDLGAPAPPARRAHLLQEADEVVFGYLCGEEG